MYTHSLIVEPTLMGAGKVQGLPFESGGQVVLAERSKRVAPRFSDSTTLENVVAELREIQRRTGIERTLAIGDLILHEFFGGDPKLWHDRRRNKNNSIRRLAERSDCPFCKSALNEAVGVYVAVVAMPSVRMFGHITASHIASVLPLPLEERHDVLELADREGWSVRDVKHQVVLLRRQEGERRGRPGASSSERALTLLRSSVHRLAEVVSQVTKLRRFSESKRDEVARLELRVAEQASLLEQWLAAPAPSSRRSEVIRIEG